MLAFRLHPEADAEGIEAAKYIKDDFRKVKVGKFRYSLVFRIRGDEVQILAMAHMSRKPGYWKDRAKDWRG
jgi:hypothetical protein